VANSNLSFAMRPFGNSETTWLYRLRGVELTRMSFDAADRTGGRHETAFMMLNAPETFDRQKVIEIETWRTRTGLKMQMSHRNRRRRRRTSWIAGARAGHRKLKTRILWRVDLYPDSYCFAGKLV
jgi:hypothetical protein